MRQRIEYIDRLKGLAILLVIIGHLNIFCFNKPLLQIFEIICTFHMPLFMVLSGIVISKYPDWKKTVTRSFILLCPFLIVGIAYTYFLNRTVLEFFTLDFNFGYWYLQTLAIFTVFLFFFHLITHRILHLTSDSTQKNILADITLTVLVLMLLYIANRFIGGRYPGILGIKQDYLYWLWFMAGVFIRKYNLIQWLSSNGIVASISLITYILYFISKISVDG